MSSSKRAKFFAIAAAISIVATACSDEEAAKLTANPVAQSAGLPADAAAIAQERGLSADDVAAALKTYMPSGKLDPYIMFSSGGQAGQVLVIGVPSMRILKGQTDSVGRHPSPQPIRNQRGL